jgi:ATP-dependent Lon protease
MNARSFAVLPLIETVTFPKVSALISIGRQQSLLALEHALAHDSTMLAVLESQRTPPFHQVGTVGRITQNTKIKKSSSATACKVRFDGLYRAHINSIESSEGFTQACITPIDTVDIGSNNVESLFGVFLSLFEDIAKVDKQDSTELLVALHKMGSQEQCVDFATSYLGFVELQDRQKILESNKLAERLEILIGSLSNRLEVIRAEKDIHENLASQINKQQRQSFLREKLKAIQKVLGEHDDIDSVKELADKIEAAKMPRAINKIALSELNKLKHTQPISPEATVIRNYLDWMLAIPWNQHSKSSLGIAESQDILNQHHYGLEKVKRRILEHVAVSSRVSNGQVLCLTGPPGVGKTSLAKSIAKALGRNLARVALGGVRDQSEIRGHRRTYIGAMPGKIIQAICNAKSMDAVILLDEIDKMGSSDFHGDPSAALLEVLDPEQNNAFKDHYMDAEIDISKCIFIATSNTLNIPEPLLDRLELVEMQSYTHQEKLQIALNHIIPASLEYHGSSCAECEFSADAISKLIQERTEEAGVRQLRREIDAIVRNIVYQIATSSSLKLPFKISNENLYNYTEHQKYFENNYTIRTPGCINGLAWTGAGGKVLQIQVAKTPGKQKTIMTGNLGKVMQESITIGRTLVRNHATSLGVESAEFKDIDLHLHVPAGATSKDGPSAGIAIATALASLLLDKVPNPNIAMTGEVDLHGNILPVGGIKEKLLAAHRALIPHVLIPEKNRNDTKDIPIEILDQLKITLVSTIQEAWKIALSVE